MQILTDTGADLTLSPEEMAGLKIHIIPQMITLDGKTYRSGVDIQPDELYRLFENSNDFPTTSLPSAGDFASMYRTLAKTDPDILSIHVASGLSGTLRAAETGARLTPEANVTLVDSCTVSVIQGWMVLAAARAIRAGWSLKRIVSKIDQIRRHCDEIFTLSNLNYVIHGGRINHLKGLLASALQIKPLLGFDKTTGHLQQLGMVRTFSGAIEGLVKIMKRQHPEGAELRVQAGHSNNPEGAARLKELVNSAFSCHWMPDVRLGAVLGAHAGPTLAGLAYAPVSIFEDLEE